MQAHMSKKRAKKLNCGAGRLQQCCAESYPTPLLLILLGLCFMVVGQECFFLRFVIIQKKLSLILG
jgi:hypothetical protein